MAATQYIKSLIAAHRVVVFVKPGCPYCTMAESALKRKNIPYHLEDISRRPDTREIQAAFQTMTGASTVPRVWVNGKFIGGGTDTEEAVRNGTIEKLLA